LYGLSKWQENLLEWVTAVSWGLRLNVYETETESEDEVIEIDEEVDEDIVITREVTRKKGKGAV
jgi:hypothetical protein